MLGTNRRSRISTYPPQVKHQVRYAQNVVYKYAGPRTDFAKLSLLWLWPFSVLKRKLTPYKMLPPHIILGLTTLVGYFVYLLLTTGRRPKDYPPGPPTLPILGNIHLAGHSGVNTAIT